MNGEILSFGVAATSYRKVCDLLEAGRSVEEIQMETGLVASTVRRIRGKWKEDKRVESLREEFDDLMRTNPVLAALKLRARGKTPEEIAIAMSMPKEDIDGLLDMAVATLRPAYADVEKVRMLEMARLDEIQEAIWDRCKAGDEKAIANFIKISDRRAKIAGLDSIKLETGEVDLSKCTPAQLQRIAAGEPIKVVLGE